MSAILTALDGSNPLAFLSACGVMRLLHLNGTDGSIKMRWVRRDSWIPELVGLEGDMDSLSGRLLRLAQVHLPTDVFSEFLGKNITVNPQQFRAFAETACERAVGGERLLGDFAAAFGSEVCVQEGKDRIEYTDLCFITGSGHQNFLGTMQDLKKGVTSAHIRDALFGAWKKNKGRSMRWDPADAAEYALRWGDPSTEGASAVWGANLLAAHGLPLLPAHPTAIGLQTTGFRNARPWPQFTWPIWMDPISLDTVRSLLSLGELQVKESEIDRQALRARGIAEVYRASRVRIGQGANFKVSFRPAATV